MYIHNLTLLPSYFPYSIDMVFRACVGNEACRQGTIYAEAGHIEGVSDSCVGDFSCKGAASMGGEIQKIEYSCTMHHACKYLAGDGGSVGVISDSCEDAHSCRYAAYGGEIQVMSESCKNLTACYGAASSSYSSRDAGFGKKPAKDEEVAIVAQDKKESTINSMSLSCNDVSACKATAADSGYINVIEDSCNAEEACAEAAKGGGTINSIIASEVVIEDLVSGFVQHLFYESSDYINLLKSSYLFVYETQIHQVPTSSPSDDDDEYYFGDDDDDESVGSVNTVRAFLGSFFPRIMIFCSPYDNSRNTFSCISEYHSTVSQPDNC